MNKAKNKFRNDASKAVFKEIKQIDTRVVFKLVRLEYLTEHKKKKSIESLFFKWEER